MKRDRKKPQMLTELKKSLGNVTIACRTVGIERWTHYDWMKKDEKYKEAVEAILDEQVDFVENKLLKNIEANDTTAIIFYLKTKGKKRGYTEKQEVDISGDLSINVNFAE